MHLTKYRTLFGLIVVKLNLNNSQSFVSDRTFENECYIVNPHDFYWFYDKHFYLIYFKCFIWIIAFAKFDFSSFRLAMNLPPML